MTDLTAAQRAVLKAIGEHAAQTGTAPSFSALASRLGLASKATVAKHVAVLRRLGLVQAGSLLLEGAQPHVSSGLLTLPVLARVAAGGPIHEGGMEREVLLSADLFKPAPAYLLHVRGDSMVDAGILDGDLIGVHPVPVADSGRIVVARLGESLTVKRLRLQGNGVLLESCNPAYPPIVPDGTEDFAIEGLYCGLVRAL